MVGAGQVRVLAIATPQRFASLPDVPTFEELGFKNFEHSGFVGLLAPRDTPKTVIATVNKGLNEAQAKEICQIATDATGLPLTTPL